MEPTPTSPRRFADLPRCQRSAIVILGAIEVSMAAVAWIDLARRPASLVRGPKWPWALVIAVNVVGPLAYWRFGRIPEPPGPAETVPLAAEPVPVTAETAVAPPETGSGPAEPEPGPVPDEPPAAPPPGNGSEPA